MKRFFWVLMLVSVVFQALAPAAWVSAQGLPPATPGRTPVVLPPISGTPKPPEPPVVLPPAETPTPEPTLIVPQPTPQPVLELWARPNFAPLGGQVTLFWQLQAQTLQGLSLVFHLPSEVRVALEGSSGEYRLAAQESGQLDLEIGAAAQLPVQVAVEVFSADSGLAIAQASLSLESAQGQIDAQGGEIRSADNRVKVLFPANALSQSARVVIGTPQADSAVGYGLSGNPFEITAYTASQPGLAAQEISQFNEEVEIEVDLSEAGFAPGQEVLLYFYNEETAAWESLPSWVNWDTQILHAATSHFTVFDYSVHDWQAGRVPSMEAFQVSGSTGAGTYAYPLNLPAGPGGFQPSLALSYNSQIIDQSNTITQASWVGMGWSLDAGSVERNLHGTAGWGGDDTFSVSVNGVSSAIVQDASGQYHLADENFWTVEKVAFPDSWVLKDKVGNVYYFEHVASSAYMTGPQTGFECGRLEYTPYHWNLTRMRNTFGQEIVYSYTKETKTFRYDKWSNSKQRCVTSETAPTDTASYLSAITYSHGRMRVEFELEDRLDYNIYMANPGPQEVFLLKRLKNIWVRQDANGDSNFETVIRRYELRYSTDPANQIWPGVAWSAGGKTSTLAAVQEFGLGGSVGLPSTTFAYGDQMHLTQVENGHGGKVVFTYQPWVYSGHAPQSMTALDYQGRAAIPSKGVANGSCFNMGFLHYGAFPGQGSAGCVDKKNSKNDEVHFHGTIMMVPVGSWGLVRPGGFYRMKAGIETSVPVWVGLWDGVNQILQTGEYIQLPADKNEVRMLVHATGDGTLHASSMELLTAVYRVTRKEMYDGRHTPYVFTYAYTNPIVNDETSMPVGTYCPMAVNGDWVLNGAIPAEDYCKEISPLHGEFWGNSQVTEIGPDGRQVVTTYRQNFLLRGRTLTVQVKDASEKIYTQSLSDYTVSDYAAQGETLMAYYRGMTHTWTETAWQENRTYDNSGAYSATRQVFTYEPSYGNLTVTVDQSWNGVAWGDYRMTKNGYYPQTANGKHLVGLPGYTNSYACPGSCAYSGTGPLPPSWLLSSHWFLYDGAFFDDAARKWNASPINGVLTGERNLTRFANSATYSDPLYSDAKYTYDAWGNRVTVTRYAGEGSYSSYASNTAQTTSTTFDTIYHTYPTSSTNPLSQTVSLSYDYALGLPLTETDPTEP